MPMTSKEMIKHLKKNGFIVISQNGSHIKMRNETTERQVIIPYYSKALKKRNGASNIKAGRAEIIPDRYRRIKWRFWYYEKIILSCYLS